MPLKEKFYLEAGFELLTGKQRLNPKFTIPVKCIHLSVIGINSTSVHHINLQ